MTAVTATIGCTIVAANYLPHVRVLVEGWRRFHAETPFVALVVDWNEGDATDEPFDTLTATGIGVGADELARMRGIYGVAELTTALKPHLLRSLLDTGADAACSTSTPTPTSTQTYGVSPSWRRRHGIAAFASCRRTVPVGRQEPERVRAPASTEPSTRVFSRSGAPPGPSCDWWAERLRRDCLFCEEMGMHADQRWLEWVPLYFDHCVMRDPGLNTAHWNLHEREIRWIDGELRVGDGPLRTFHFAGFDPERPEMLTWYERPNARYEMRAGSDVARMCADYARRLLASGYRQSRSVPYRFGVSAAGTPLGNWERRTYREMLIAAEARGDGDLPGPFEPGRSREFERMLRDPRSMNLLSEQALVRVHDARLARPVDGDAPLTRLREAMGMSRRLLRRIPGRRHGWMPFPLPSDVTRNEYAAGVVRSGCMPLKVPSSV